jgi:hypothetical protein
MVLQDLLTDTPDLLSLGVIGPPQLRYGTPYSPKLRSGAMEYQRVQIRFVPNEGAICLL